MNVKSTKHIWKRGLIIALVGGLSTVGLAAGAQVHAAGMAASAGRAGVSAKYSDAGVSPKYGSASSSSASGQDPKAKEFSELMLASMTPGQLGDLTVTGRAEGQYAPTEAAVTIAVRTAAKTAQQAKRENDADMADLVSLVTSLGIDKSDMSSAGIDMEPQYDSSGNNKITGYEMVNKLRISVKNLNKLEPIVDKALSNTRSLQGIVFITNLTEAQKDALIQEAIADAKHRAEVTARALGFKVVGVKTVSPESLSGQTERYAQSYGMVNFALRSAAAESGTAVYSGLSTLRQSVNITFVIKQLNSL